MSSFPFSKSKDKYIVRDGYFKYIVTIYPHISCQCIMSTTKPKTYCSHIVCILRTEYKLSDFVIKYLHLMHASCSELFLNKDKIDKINDIIMSKLEKDECGFCMTSLTNKKYNLELHECSFCNKLVHNKCNAQWLITKNTGCIYCRQ